MGDGASPLTQQQLLQQQYIQRSLAGGAKGAGMTTAPKTDTTDVLDPAAVAERQKAALAMREAMNEDFGTSSRGIDAAPGSGLKGATGDPLADGPLIASSGAVDVDAIIKKKLASMAGGGAPSTNTGAPRTSRQ